MVSAVIVANEFIRLGREDGETFTPMQLLKLVYIAHGWMLAVYSESLIDDDIQAWRYGPVIPRLYSWLKEYGGSSVTSFIGNTTPKPLDNRVSQVIDFVYKQYKGLDGIKLSAITHQQGTPWHQTYEAGCNNSISDDLIQHHYTQLFQKALKQVEG